MSDRELTIRKGQGAARLLSDELAMDALAAIAEDLKAEWVRSRPDDVAGREGVYRIVHAMQLLTDKLQAMRADGLKAEHDTQHETAEAKGQSAYH